MQIVWFVCAVVGAAQPSYDNNPASKAPLHTSTSKDQISIRQELLRVVVWAADLNWLKNQVKLVGEREILASLIEFKHHSMAETI